MKWQCEKCGEEHAAQFQQCWQCSSKVESSVEPLRSESLRSESLRSESGNSPGWFTRHALLGTKLFACFVSATIGYRVSRSPIDFLYNGFSLLFVVSLVCLWPKIRWIAPCVIIGFCVGPILFVPGVNGGGSQSTNAAIIGAMFGMVIGGTLEFGLFESRDEDGNDEC